MNHHSSSFRASRMFAAEAVKPSAAVVEPLTAKQRRGLSDSAWRERLDAELAYVYGLYVPSPTQRECEEVVMDHIDDSRWARPGARDSLYVLGVPGTGKTTAVRAAALRYHRQRLEEAGLGGSPDPTWERDGYVCDLVPAIMMTVRAEARNKAFVSQIVDFLGYPVGNMTASTLADRIPALAARHAVGLLAADDVRNLADLGRDRDAIHNTIKNINTELGYLNVCSVYIGNPDESGSGNLFSNAQLAQRLIPLRFEDMNFDLRAGEDTFDNIMWLDYLEDWERALAPVLPDMGEHDLASRLGRRLWYRSRGSVGGLSGLLKRAVADQLRDRRRGTQLTLTKDRIDKTAMPERFQRSPDAR